MNALVRGVINVVGAWLKILRAIGLAPPSFKFWTCHCMHNAKFIKRKPYKLKVDDDTPPGKVNDRDSMASLEFKSNNYWICENTPVESKLLCLRSN